MNKEKMESVNAPTDEEKVHSDDAGNAKMESANAPTGTEEEVHSDDTGNAKMESANAPTVAEEVVHSDDADKSAMEIANAVCLRLSAFFLAAALGCGIVRRTGLWEPPAVVSVWILPVATAAAVGYITNWLAIQLLFRPYKKMKILGITFQGLIPKRQETLAKSLSVLIPTKLIPEDKIMFKIRRAIRKTMKDPKLATRLHATVSEYIRDEHQKQAFIRQLSTFLDAAGSIGADTGLTPSNVRKFYRSYGSAFVKEKVIRDKAVRAKILDVLREQVPDIVREVRTIMPILIKEYKRKNNIVKGQLVELCAGENGEYLPWEEIEQTIIKKMSNKDADLQVKQKLAEFESRLEIYLASPEFEADLTSLKQDRDIGDKFKSLRDDLAGKLLEFLEDEIVWEIIRKQALPGIRFFVQEQIFQYKGEIMEGLDLAGNIYESISKMKPKDVHQMIDNVSNEELGAIQLLGFGLGAIAGFLLALAL